MIVQGCQNSTDNKDAAEADSSVVRLITLDPGHFHAALVQKSMYEGVDSTVYVYAPEGPDVESHLKLIDSYNSRSENPTSWVEKVYTGDDYLEKMLAEKPGNVVVMAGNNQKKTHYIKQSIDAGLNVLADKPMAITTADFNLLKDAFSAAEKNGVLLYDIMTERYEIRSILQKEMSQLPELFGELEKGTRDNPAIIKESVHHFFKEVSGVPLKRPSWFYDVDQAGNGLVDITTHFVDLAQWQAFPDTKIDYTKDIEVLDARNWSTDLSLSQFEKSTGATSFPEFLQKDVKGDVLQVYSNGEMNYSLKGVHVRISVTWNFEAPAGTGDTHVSVLRGTKANLVIRQGKEQGYKPVLYIEAAEGTTLSEEALKSSFEKLQAKFPGVDYKKHQSGWEVVIPEKYQIGHEAHFALVTEKFLEYLKDGNMPGWEVPNMIAKYYTTTQALEKAVKE